MATVARKSSYFRMDSLVSDLGKFSNCDSALSKPMEDYIKSLRDNKKRLWSDYTTFWPP